MNIKIVPGHLLTLYRDGNEVMASLTSIAPVLPYGVPGARTVPPDDQPALEMLRYARSLGGVLYILDIERLWDPSWGALGQVEGQR